MTQSKSKPILYSTLGVVAMALILVAANFIIGSMRARIDLTDGHVYTLSDGTRAILGKLSNPVKIRYYATRTAVTMPPAQRAYIQHVEDMLAEYKLAAGGKVVIEKYDPQPDSEAEDSANLDGVEGQVLPSGEKLYNGLTVSQLDQKVTLPVLSPERETLLEYDVSRAISAVSAAKRPTLGVMTALPIYGSPVPGPQGQQPPWSFLSELRRDYDIKNLGLDVDRIDPDINVLLVVHPRDITDSAQYAIDQFVLRGGKLIAFLDPFCYFDQTRGTSMIPFGRSSLPKLIEAWGLKFDLAHALADMDFATAMGPNTLPTLLSVSGAGVDHSDVVTGQIQSMMVPFAGVFTGTPVAGLKEAVLVHSSKTSQLVDAAIAGPPGDQVVNQFKASGTEYPIAVRLTGKFKTAFPGGKPPKPVDGAKGDADKDKPAEPAKADEKPLTEGSGEGVVVLVGDADMLSDEASVEVREFLGQRILVPRNHNLSFVENLVEQMSGDSSLISLRSRASFSRPFTVIRAIEAKAADAYRGKIKELEDSLAATQQRLGELQQRKSAGQATVISPEQQAEIDNFRRKESAAKRDLKELRKSLRKDTDAVEFHTKVANIALMPFLVALAGILIALVKRNKVAAK